MKILEEFRDFAMKGNVVDMGVGIVIGAAFTQIVNSFVTDIINPPLSLLTGSVDFTSKVWTLKEATENTAAITLNYGSFLTALLNFIIVAFVIFIVIKQMNKIREELEKEKEKIEEDGVDQVSILSEIRDILKR